MKKILSVILCLMLLCTLASAAAGGFDTPEAAVECYLNGLKNQDLDQMLSAFFFEDHGKDQVMSAYLDRVKTYSPTVCPAFPQGNALTDSLNAELARSMTVTSIRYTLTAFVTQGLEFGRAYPIRDEGTGEDFISNHFDLSRLELVSTLDNIQVITPQMAEMFGYLRNYSGDKIQEMLEKSRLAYNADEISDRIGLFTIDGKMYAVAPGVVRYGDRWYLSSLNGLAASIMGIGMEYSAFLPLTQ